ncbi:MAG: ribonuclease P protein component [Acidobacteriota bacterium]|nr:ribonuclease P protein component [Acidobacteriota bacterium]MDE2921951.1 ribonuclease P protein component [Acidobacteriota bacterium]MDE3265961.1 ribonuclease P protein component [Acidobacteriota bacterium]
MSRSGNPARASGFEQGAERIRSSSDYRQVYRRGRRLHGEYAVFHVRSNDVGHARLGLTAGRRVGGAVARNRLRRRVREHYRQVIGRERLAAVDVVVHLKPRAAAAHRRTFYRELDRLFETVARQGGPGGRSRGRRKSRR